jgi:hypothetical protein
MGTLTDTTPTPAEDRFLAAIERAADGRPKYPRGTAFVDVERLVELAPMVARYVRDRRPIVLMYPDGDERVILPSRPRTVVLYWKDSLVQGETSVLKDSLKPALEWVRGLHRALR